MGLTVVSDTCHYLPPEIVESRGIVEVPLHVHVDGAEYKESELTDLDAYYGRLRDLSEVPTTSQPSIGEFLAAYEPLLADGGEVVSVHLAGGLSGTSESARQARDQLGEAAGRVHVVDSATACGGEGLVVLAACAAAAAGRSGAEAADHARAAREHMKQWFSIDTLEYLKRGGRIGGAQAWFGTALKIKPILAVESEITPVERVRTSGRAFERMVDLLRSRQVDGADTWVVQHIQAADAAARLVERGREIYNSEPLFVSEIGPVIGTHVGPGLLGCGALPSSFLA
jgi:DegV family protein with EDD domain